jgi:hypothetical protein
VLHILDPALATRRDEVDRGRCVRTITGTYRGPPVTHYIDPRSGLNVIADMAGNYVSGWRLGADQLESVLKTGRLF